MLAITSQLERDAAVLAVERHGAQLYGAVPYTVHLADVRRLLASFHWTGSLLVAAWLHDVLEDTDTTREELRDRFGAEVEGLVWTVSGFGTNRKARNADAWTKVAAYGQDAATLKLADRVANVSSARSTRPDLFRMYQREQGQFRAAICPLGDGALWELLDELLRA